ncbi:hypothetical protein [Psychrobacter sp. I-STPA10]|uniref:hypothetical protein n=1 Tax=Psychrobacter sp. I-STPA10 TaxID=2585769 RepID=UPI001E4555F4|nr:hypothetical protein [Psychrobacter sp. I-STPA10]
MSTHFAVYRPRTDKIKMPIVSKSICLSVLTLSMLLTMSACQRNNTETQDSQIASIKIKDAVASAEALAAIEEFQPIYITQVLNLQNSLQAEYEALQTADVPMSISRVDSENKETETVKTLDEVKSMQDVPNLDNDSDIVRDTNTISDSVNSTVNDNASADSSDSDSDNDADTESSRREVTQTQVNTLPPKPELSVDAVLAEQQPDEVQLPLATTVITPPKILTKEQIKTRYQTAMQALYSSADKPLTAETVDTLLSIAMLVPDLFKNAELAERLTIKMPTLARLLQQYQIWEQIEAQQSAELQAIKEAQILEQQKQKQDFEKLMAEFNQTIAGYDEQIAKYEQKLKEFE